MGANNIILTIGGGGFTHASDPELDDFCLRFVPEKPNLGYIGWANEDNEVRTNRFYDRFRDVAGSSSHLPQGTSGSETREWLAGKHMVFLGGGNTASLIAALSSDGLLAHFAAANVNGCVLAGVSAGGICWFDWILSDSDGRGYAPMQGLSLVCGGVCPHYSSEVARKPQFEAVVARRADGAAYAVDDGACTVAINGEVKGYFSARDNSAAYRLTRQNGAVASTRLPIFGSK
ncbi:Type 1 glutamine amidotransferase-like domain-containing protein [Roseovarius sp. 2305UL8-3]|uniref:Type 1 glutamine amidotransferase-like domain-containing protein n=1 Tax=Roseovarius conchicola TaxID=3121636 RepID=UPI0035292E29